jgi:hypothetical protein
MIYDVAAFMVSWFMNVLISSSSLSTLTNISSDALLGLVAAAFFLIFMILNMVAMLTLRKMLSGNMVGIIGGLIGLVTSIVRLLNYIATISAATGTLLPYTYLILTALTFTMMGVFFLLHRQRLPDGDVAMVTGMIYLFAGLGGTIQYAYYSYPYYSFSNPFLLIVAGVLGASCFLARSLAK